MTNRIRVRALLCALAAWLSASLGMAATVPHLVGNVSRVIDGDTLVVDLASGPIRVRLYGVDAPERNQAGGHQATDALRQLLADGHVELEPISQDRYSRMIARVFHGHVDVGARMVEQGNAWVYRHYLHREDRAWCGLERGARQAHRGLWAGRDPIAPWNFRRHILSAVVPACP